MPFLNETLVANGTTSLGRIVFAKAMLDMILNDHVVGMAVNAGGTGYVVGETFDIVGGTPIGAFVASGVVTAASGGVVTGVKYISAGAYSTLPGAVGAVTTNASAAGNDDLTVDLTTLVAQWTLDRSTYVDDATDFEWIATSVKAANPATIGILTVTGSGNDAVRMFTASSFNTVAAWTAQPDASPDAQMFLNVAGQNPEIYVSTTERRVNFMCRDGNNVQYAGLGLFIPLTNNDASYPFPGIAHAQSQAIRAMSASYNQDGNGNNNAGVCNPGTYTTVFPAVRYRDNLSSAWKTIANVALSASVDSCCWPHAQRSIDYSLTHAPSLSGKGSDPWSSSTQEMVFQDSNNNADGWFNQPNGGAGGVQGVSPLGTGLQMTLMVTTHIISNSVGDVQVVGIIDGYENCHGIGLTAFEETETYLGASRYIVFPDTNGTDLGQWVGMEII